MQKHSNLGPNCPNSNDFYDLPISFIYPTAKGYGDVSLDPGPQSGRVNVYLNDGTSLVLGTICDEYWTDENSAVICRQLGFRDFGTSFDFVDNTDFDSGTGPIGDFECVGTETHLSECTEYPTPFFCDHSDDVVVYCQRESIMVVLILSPIFCACNSSLFDDCL